MVNWTDMIGVGAQSTLEGTKFLPEKYVLKISKMPEFDMILARKIFFPNFRGGGHVPPPVSYAYAVCCLYLAPRSTSHSANSRPRGRSPPIMTWLLCGWQTVLGIADSDREADSLSSRTWSTKYEYSGSAPFRLIPIRLTWTKLLLTDVLNAWWRNAWRNPDPNPNPNPNDRFGRNGKTPI